MPSSLKLVGPATMRSFRCLWMLEELGVPYVHQPSMPHSQDVQQHNPLGKVPVLIDTDGFAIYESMAINNYLGEKFRSKAPLLVPSAAEPRKRALYDQTLSVLLTELDAQGLWIHRKHEALGDFFTHIPDAVEHARKYFNKTNRALVEQLRVGGPFLLGSDFTAVDIIYVHCLDWSKAIGWDKHWKENPDVKAYLSVCKGRRAYLAVKRIRDAEIQAFKMSNDNKESKL